MKARFFFSAAIAALMAGVALSPVAVRAQDVGCQTTANVAYCPGGGTVNVPSMRCDEVNAYIARACAARETPEQRAAREQREEEERERREEEHRLWLQQQTDLKTDELHDAEQRRRERDAAKQEKFDESKNSALRQLKGIGTSHATPGAGAKFDGSKPPANEAPAPSPRQMGDLKPAAPAAPPRTPECDAALAKNDAALREIDTLAKTNGFDELVSATGVKAAAKKVPDGALDMGGERLANGGNPVPLNSLLDEQKTKLSDLRHEADELKGFMARVQACVDTPSLTGCLTKLALEQARDEAKARVLALIDRKSGLKATRENVQRFSDAYRSFTTKVQQTAQDQASEAATCLGGAP